MSMANVVCEICKEKNAIYSCPRCGRKYCSSNCYKSKEHDLCSEAFYREWVESSLREKAFDEAEKNKMIGILKKYNSDVTEDTEVEVSIVERFAGLNIDSASEDVLWQNLSETEQAEFIELIKDEKSIETFIHLIQPWWTVIKVERIRDVEEPENKQLTSRCPPHPMEIRSLSSITKVKPSECLRFNLVNMIYSYAFLYRFYNCELSDFLEDVVNSLLQFSPVLSGERNYLSLEESVQDSIRLIVNSDLSIPLDFVKSIANDVCSILQGPENAPPTYFILCALHDIELMLLELRHELTTKKNGDKSLKEKLLPAAKKIAYFMSWCLDFSSVFSELSSDLIMLMVPDLIIEHPSLEPAETSKEVIQKVPTIEEID